MQSRKISLLRGRSIRITRLDTNGRPVFGDSSVVTTKGYTTATLTTRVEEGEAITLPNAAGENCVNEPATPTFNGFTAELTFCEIDFAGFELLTGQEVILDSFGRAIGIDESTEIDLGSVRFALELWAGADAKGQAASEGSQGFFGYILLPHLSGGVVGDVTIENAAITFTVNNVQTKGGNAWGSGPYNVELVDGEPAPLSTPARLNTHRRIMVTEVAPPEPHIGSTPLLDPAAPALTGITATPTGLSVDLDPVPVGTDPIWYDFGDGSWDYAETGSYTHVYAAAGTYTITARRGLSEATAQVAVAAV